MQKNVKYENESELEEDTEADVAVDLDCVKKMRTNGVNKERTVNKEGWKRKAFIADTI